MRRYLTHPLYLTAAAAALLLLLLAVLADWLQQEEQALKLSRFEQRAALGLNTLQTPFTQLEHQLVALRTLFELKPNLSRREFDYFVSQQSISAYGIAAFEWIPRISAGQVPQLEQRAREEGMFDFRVRHYSPDQEELYPILYSAAAQMNGLSLGTNLGSEPALLRAMQAATRDGTLHIGSSANTHLDETEGQEMRFLMPVFRRQPDQTQRLAGFVAAMVRFEEMINILLGQLVAGQSGLGLKVHEVTAAGTVLLYNSRWQSAAPAPDAPRQTYNRTLGGRQFRFTFYDLAPDGTPWINGYGGTVSGVGLFGLVLIGLLYVSLQRKYRAEAFAIHQTRTLQQVEYDYQNLFHKVVEGVYRAQLDGGYQRVNPALANAFGYDSPEQMVADVTDIGRQLHLSPQRHQHFLRELSAREEVIGFEWEGRTRQGQRVWLSENAYLSRQKGGQLCYEGTLTVITERKLNEQKLSFQAERDPLTGLFNRKAFIARLNHRLGTERGAVLFIDLDGFKRINDRRGHSAGDEVLLHIAGRLQACLREQDLLSRFGGDEFVVYVNGLESRDSARPLLDRLKRIIAEPVPLESLPAQVSASIGITFTQADGSDVDAILHNADTAMYEVKRRGKNNYLFFDQALRARSSYRDQLESALETALQNQQFRLVYQPVVQLESGHILGFEALLRWHCPILGEVPVGDFIPLLERGERITEVGDWIIARALEQLAIFQRQLNHPQLYLNINLSPVQLQHPSLIPVIRRALSRSRIPPDQVNFELTETALYGQQEQVAQRLEEIRRLGCGLYIDDFGTGYSSLERLVKFPATGLKIDRTFVSDMESDRAKATVVEGLLIMSDLLQLEVVAEGIESEKQRRLLLKHGCRKGQGFYYYRPLEVAQVMALTASGDRAAESARHGAPAKGQLTRFPGRGPEAERFT